MGRTAGGTDGAGVLVGLRDVPGYLGCAIAVVLISTTQDSPEKTTRIQKVDLRPLWCRIGQHSSYSSIDTTGLPPAGRRHKTFTYRSR